MAMYTDHFVKHVYASTLRKLRESYILITYSLGTRRQFFISEWIHMESLAPFLKHQDAIYINNYNCQNNRVVKFPAD